MERGKGVDREGVLLKKIQNVKGQRGGSLLEWGSIQNKLDTDWPKQQLECR